MSDNLTIKNWDKFQHYKNRNPPWIKLATDTFQDYEFSLLSDASKLLALACWTLSARVSKSDSGEIPADLSWIKAQCSLGELIKEEHLQELADKGFITCASKVLASCKQSASAEERRVEESRVEGEVEKEQVSVSPKPPSAKPTNNPPYQQIQTEWNTLSKAIGLKAARDLTKSRKTAIRQRWKNEDWREHHHEAMERLKHSSFVRGSNKQNWIAGLDWFLKPDTLNKILEGTYDDNDSNAGKRDIACRDSDDDLPFT